MAEFQSNHQATNKQRKKPVRLTPEQKAAAVQAYQDGESMESLAKRLGVGIGTICRTVQQAGATARNPLKDISGQSYGSLTVMSHERRGFWRCKCVCGREEVANSTALRLGRHVRCAACRNPEETPERKKCRKCKEEYPNTEEFFLRNNQYRFGLRARCKTCTREEGSKSGLRARRNIRREVLSHYSGGGEPFCACCGEKTFEFLALDHLEGSSREDYKKYGNGFFYRIRREGYKLKAQTLCHSCNACKAQRGVCVHQSPTIDAEAFYARRKPKDRIVLPPVTPELVAESWGITKQCYLCRREFPHSFTYFPKHKQMAAGLLNRCKECDRIEHYRSLLMRRAKHKQAVFAHYCPDGPRCACCGITTVEFLTVDHIHGGGLRHRKEEKITSLWKWLIDHQFPEGFRILCFCCNMASGFYGVCPCQRK